MCGIICLIDMDIKTFLTQLDKLSPRGPDSLSYLKSNNIYFGFTRLSIMDLSSNGLQPFINDNHLLLCNGEIYNYKELIKQYDLSYTKNDCRVLIPLIKKLGFKNAIKILDAEFAIIYYDGINLFATRDKFGVRPLYVGYKNKKIIGFASELKAIHSVADYVKQVNPNEIYMNENIIINYNKLNYDLSLNNKQYIKINIRKLLTSAVKKRLQSDVPIGFLLSGGLDSSLIVAIAAKLNKNITCFSIGFENSPDVESAKIVANYLNIKNHHIIPFSVELGLSYIEKVIEITETYDITTIRASVPQYIMAKYISENTNIKVLLSGEGSDEIFGGYKYFRTAPNIEEFHNETIRLLEELYLFDNKRTDRTMASNGLEVRVPYLDNEFVEFITKINPELLMYSNDQIEKQILRDSFIDYLPNNILYRSKEAFSDAVSNSEISWYRSIQSKVETIITDEELINNPYTINKPEIKEALYYRKIFDKIYPYCDAIIPHYWMPSFQNKKITDPSATIL